MFLIIIPIILSFMAAHSAYIGNKYLRWRTKPSEVEQLLLEERKSLKKEQSQYNMMDAFAKYSKLQRKINIIDDKLKMFSDRKNTFLVKTLATYDALLYLELMIKLI
ncbi:hypothetical protein GWI33_013125 [Rhynchophorus ferrugineus]|uniref:Guided entry of tail-anchored proteins factor 1 n=1 Tax=Rhynchophorus ferrugineus TaxID=354439 RepID=A0A834I4C5_RHYFE|nr:hypothetical protein GWI33_013125 [Rhynchophorus ferrugineus]